MGEHETHNPPNQCRNFRLAAGYSQEDVAFLLNIKNAGRISEWENGIANPSIENLLKLSVIYQVLPDQLYYALRKKVIGQIAHRKAMLQERKARKSAAGPLGV